MRITVIGSVSFAGKLVDICKRLRELGHEPLMHEQMYELARGTAEQLKDGDKEHAAIKRKYNFIKAWHDIIKSGDALLVCNFDKNNISNYIGGNMLMEMGFAHVYDKRVFLLNPIPTGVPYTDEIKAVVDMILDNDLTKIK